MMRTITLKPVDFTPALARALERRALIRTLRPSRRVLGCTRAQGMADTVYVASHRHGAHKLVCIRCNVNGFNLNSHPGNEEFIFINSTGARFKPFYLLIGLHKHAQMRRKCSAGTLTRRDFVLARVKYNDPLVSIFTMLRDTVHCEVVLEGAGQPPIFFVTEPSRLKMDRLRLNGYALRVEPAARGKIKP